MDISGTNKITFDKDKFELVDRGNGTLEVVEKQQGADYVPKVGETYWRADARTFTRGECERDARFNLKTHWPSDCNRPFPTKELAAKAGRHMYMQSELIRANLLVDPTYYDFSYPRYTLIHSRVGGGWFAEFSSDSPSPSVKADAEKVIAILTERDVIGNANKLLDPDK